MIAVFTNTSNVYRPQWHPDPPRLARPGLLQTVSVVPRRKPEHTLAPWMQPAWTMGEPWLSSRRRLQTVPGNVGLPIPPPRSPIAMARWLQPDWTMGEPWLSSRRTLRTPPSGAAVLPPPPKPPDSNTLVHFFPPWTITAPWSPRPTLLRDASAVPTRQPDQSFAPFIPAWTMDSPWIWSTIARQIPSSGAVVPDPPPRQPDSQTLATFFPPWTMTAPWTVPPSSFTQDASVPPLMAPQTFAWHQHIPDWQADAAPWQWLKLWQPFPFGVPSLVAPAPAGTVPIRYIIGETANVVPVERVFVMEAGVVPCREMVGPANVVPVRDAPGETPRVKIMHV
jgi:hypothetical protein